MYKRQRADGGMGFVRSTGEPCMYRWEDGDEWAIIGLACDNAIHLESSDAVHADVLARLQAKYEWVDEGLVSEGTPWVIFEKRGHVTAGSRERGQGGGRR